MRRRNNVPPTCHGKCVNIKHGYSNDGLYSKGYGRCNVCDKFIYTQDLRCFCCLTADQLIYTNNGVKPISDIVIGDKVLDINGEFTPVTNTFEHDYEGDIYKVGINGHRKPIIMTAEHPTFILDNSKRFLKNDQLLMSPLLKIVESKDLQIGQRIIFPKIKTKPSKKYWIIGGNPRGNNNGDRYYNLIYIPITADLCRLWGYYLAEGSCNYRTVSFYFDRDETEYIKDIQHILADLGMTYTGLNLDKRSRTCTLNISSTSLSRALVRDFGKLADGKYLPEWVFDLPLEYQRELLIGWYNGDGTSYIRKNSKHNGFDITTISKRLVYDMKLLLSNLGVLSAIHYCKKHDDRRQAYMLHIGASKGYILNEETGVNENAKSKNYKRFMTTKIKNIEKEYFKGKVYNIETESHTYTTNAFVTHNCKMVLRRNSRMGKYRKRLDSVERY